MQTSVSFSTDQETAARLDLLVEAKSKETLLAITRSNLLTSLINREFNTYLAAKDLADMVRREENK